MSNSSKSKSLPRQQKKTKNSSGDLLTKYRPSPLKPFGGAQSITVRQVHYPSTGLTISGTGWTYNASSGIITSGTTDGAFSYYESLGQISNPSEYTVKYDQYRLDEICVWITPLLPTVTQSSLGWNDMILVTRDYDDNTVISVRATLMEYEGIELHNPYKPFKVILKPRIAVNSGTGSLNLAAGWLDCNDTTVAHYGIKSILGITSVVGMKTSIIVESLWSFRSNR